MQKDTNITNVVFRKFKDGEIIALMPYEIELHYECLSYMHIGQHSVADYNHCINTTKLATESEYAELKKEMEFLGYNIKVIKKLNSNKFRTAINLFRERFKY